MCGRYVLKREDLEALVKQFGLRSLEEFHSRYNLAPTQIVPLIRRREPGQPELTAVRWGLIPAWSKPDAPVKPLVNVRAETLATRFRGVLKHRRCIVPASGFYEWQVVGSRKQPWYFSARNGGPIAFAGVWDRWHGNADVDLETCAIITTTPNGTLSPIHDRMPVVLTPEQCQAWLADDDAAEPTAAAALLSPAPDNALIATKVVPAVSSVRNDGPECIAPITEDPPEPQLSLGL